MGKRKKSSRGPVKRQVLKLDTKFNCLFCNHENVVTCVLNKKECIGSLSCKICGQSFQTRINALSQPVDVYSDWFDAVEEVNQGKASDSEDDEGSSSDYESDSDGEPVTGRAKPSGRAVGADEDDEDEEEYDEAVNVGRRSAGAVLDSDDE